MVLFRPVLMVLFSHVLMVLFWAAAVLMVLFQTQAHG